MSGLGPDSKVEKKVKSKIPLKRVAFLEDVEVAPLQPINFFVEPFKGEKIAFKAFPNDLVSIIENQLEEEIGFDKTYNILTINGSATKYNQSIIDSGIKEGNILQIEHGYCYRGVSQDDIFNWLNGDAPSWEKSSGLNTSTKVEVKDWCAVGGSAYKLIFDHTLGKNKGLQKQAMQFVAEKMPEIDAEQFMEFFEREVLSTEDLDIITDNEKVKELFPKKDGKHCILCSEYDDTIVDFLPMKTTTPVPLSGTKIWVQRFEVEESTTEVRKKPLSFLEEMKLKNKTKVKEKKDDKRKARKILLEFLIQKGHYEQ